MGSGAGVGPGSSSSRMVADASASLNDAGGLIGALDTSGGGVGVSAAESRSAGATAVTGVDGLDSNSGGGVSGPESSARTAAASAARAAASPLGSVPEGRGAANGLSSDTGGGGGAPANATGCAPTTGRGPSGAGVNVAATGSSSAEEGTGAGVTTLAEASSTGTALPTMGTPRGCVVVRRRTVGVEKSPAAIPMGPLRSLGTAARGRRVPEAPFGTASPFPGPGVATGAALAGAGVRPLSADPLAAVLRVGSS
jgi:hypothetical protein